MKRYVLLLCLFAQTIAVSFAQSLTVNGTVVDKVSGEGMPGVAILVKGTSSGTVTDADGRYNLQVPGEEAVLVFSFIGYMSQEVPVKGKSTINIALVEDVESLEELVVVGYGTQKRATLTGSVSEVHGKEITQSPQPNVSNSLAGRIPGVIATNRGGEPGYDGSNISIRGLATTGNNDVLVVVDGVPGQIGGLERLDPNDIESVTVLKDASAAIYGSRAANGVILVTTKKGKAGKPTISYTFNQGFSSPTRLPEMADAATYARIRNEIAYYNNTDGGLNQVYTEDEIQKFGDGSDPLLYPNTNWQQEALQKVALQNQHNLSVSGGSERVQLLFVFGEIVSGGFV